MTTKPLISVDELAALLDTGAPLHLLDLSYYLGQPGRGEQEYRRGHLPGAVFVDVEEVFSAHPDVDGVGGRHPLPDRDRLQDGLRAAGVNPDVQIVAYDQRSSMASARAWWVLRDVGITHVRVLDGGRAAWLAAGRALAADVPVVDPGTIIVGEPGQAPQVTARDIPAVQSDGHRVIDVRAAKRFRGESEPIDPVAGHIPGAINLPAAELQDATGRFLVGDALADALQGLAPGDVVSCGSGITASNLVLAAEQAGVRGLRLYPGSWSDWISDPERPVATGE